MVGLLKRWYEYYTERPEIMVLLFMLILGFVVVSTMGAVLAPVLASLVIAYIMLWAVSHLEQYGCCRQRAILGVYLGFLGLFLVLMLVCAPMLWQQLANMLEDLPTMVLRVKEVLYLLPERFPDFVSKNYIDHLSRDLLLGARSMMKDVLAASLVRIPILIMIVVYLVLVPVLVFFMVKDRDLLVRWFQKWLPQDRVLLVRVWHEVNQQLGNYIRGKVAQVFITGGISYVIFVLLQLKYAALLGFLVGLSVIVPYVGAALVTFPVLWVGLFQWGLGPQFYYLMAAYALIQAFDGNILVPLLFSEAVNLHPIAIIVSVLVFGGIWGFWGVFFAIPLATLANSVLNALDYPYEEACIHE